MTDTTQDQIEEMLVSMQTAAETLHELLPEEQGYWTHYLHNNRRADRQPAYRIPYRKRGRSVLYRAGDIADFVAWETDRRYRIAKVPGRDSDAITVKLDPYCLEALRELERRTETPASEILENLFPALLLGLYAATDAVDQAAPGEERTALLAHLEQRKGGQR